MQRAAFLPVLMAAGLLVALACIPAPVAAPTPVVAPVATPTATPAPALPLWDYMMRAPEAKPKYGGVVRTAGPVEMAHWDLHQGAPAYTGITNVYNKLVYRDLGKGHRGLVPDLARSWEMSQDGLTYIFPLRQGVKWHDGVEFTADDVVATYQRIINPPPGVVTGAAQGNLEMVKEVTALDKHTVQFVLKRPTPWFVATLAGAPHFGYDVIYPKHFLERHNFDVRKEIPPGTGPFLFKKRVPGEFIEMERNPNYWNPALPYVDAIKALHIPVWADRGTAVLTGLADFTWNGDRATWRRAQALPDKFVVSSPPVESVFGIWINNKWEPFNDRRVRRALHLAVDRVHMYEVYSGVTIPMFPARWLSMANPFTMSEEEILKLPGYRRDKSEDIAEAKRLLTEAGYPRGFHTKAMGAAAPAFGEVWGVAFLAQLRDTLNITSDLALIERGLEGEALKKGDWAIGFFTGAGPGVQPDPTPMWNATFRCGGPQNWGKYCNPKFDQLLDQLLTEFDAVKRRELFYRAMDMLDEDPPVWPHGNLRGLAMGAKYVKGLMLEDLGAYPWGRYETVWLDK